jgi:threonine/homoserine/homoserine lactone efflux protein
VSLQVVAAAFGMGAVVERSALAFTVVKYLGAAYIVYLGVQAIRHRNSMAEALDQRIAPTSPLQAARDGFFVGATNPKTIVILVTVMPGFAVPAAGNLPLQLVVLGALFPVAALVLDSCWAFVAGTGRDWFARSPRRMAAIGGTAGLVMIGIGASIALTGRKD